MLELIPRAGLADSRFLPPFSQMASALADQLDSPAFWQALGSSLRGWALGLAIAMGAGVVLGIVIGSIPALRAATTSTIEFLRPIPSVALIPLVVLLFGSDMRSTLILVVYASFWQILVQVLYGVADVDPVARDTARSYRFSPWAQVRTVIWPTALPYVMTGFRLAAAVALILEITGELVIGSPGLGKSIAVAQSSGAVTTMYALVIVTGLIGVAVNLIARRAERRVLRWHPSVRGEVPA
ncbi:MAG: ABC transporter permease subunit [Actinophytocola sp.]|nr:ABC transporter permease subunit [Actinophytocola sp.]